MAEETLNVRIKLRSDTSTNWTSANPVLYQGEFGYEIDTGKGKFGDGTTAWNDLGYFGGDVEIPQCKTYTVNATAGQNDLDAIATVATSPKSGDVAVVIRNIDEEATKQSYTGYSYDATLVTGDDPKTGWKALDGNYNAENVYFGSDLTITAPIGVQTIPSSGSKTLDTSGKNVKQVLDMIMAEEKNPTTTQPSVSVACSQMKGYEVGSKVTPQWTVTLNAGNYSYGPATGVTATTYTVTDTDSNSSDQASGSFPELTVKDGENYSISATVGHTEGAVPKTNLGNDYAAGKIAAGSKSGSKGTITGYRNSFYGTTADKSAATTSAVIRALSGKSNKALANGNTFNVTIPVGALRVLIAYPATLRDVNSILDVNGMNAEIKTGFTQTTVSVEGANGYSAIEYKVYTMDYANPNDTANTYKVTI